MRRFLRSLLPLTGLILGTVATGFAGSMTTGPPSVNSVVLAMQASDLELEYFGFDPSAFFFFTGNTNYQNNGVDEIQIIAAALNPAGSTSLKGITTHTVTFSVDDSGDIMGVTGTGVTSQGSSVPLALQQTSSIPEPSFTWVVAAAILLVRKPVRDKSSLRS